MFLAFLKLIYKQRCIPLLWEKFIFMNASLFNINMIPTMKSCCFCAVYIPQSPPNKKWLWLHDTHTALKHLLLMFLMYNKNASVFGSAYSTVSFENYMLYDIQWGPRVRDQRKCFCFANFPHYKWYIQHNNLYEKLKWKIKMNFRMRLHELHRFEKNQMFSQMFSNEHLVLQWKMNIWPFVQKITSQITYMK